MLERVVVLVCNWSVFRWHELSPPIVETQLVRRVADKLLQSGTQPFEIGARTATYLRSESIGRLAARCWRSLFIQ